MSSAIELRTALIAALRADTALTALLGGAKKVFNIVPPNTPKPYVRVRISSRPWDTGTDRGKEHEVIANGWTSSEKDAAGVIREGDLAAEKIMDRVELVFRAFCDSCPRVLSSHRAINLTLIMADVRDDDGGKSQLGYARYRAVTEELP